MAAITLTFHDERDHRPRRSGTAIRPSVRTADASPDDAASTNPGIAARATDARAHASSAHTADDERGGADDPFELLALDETHRSEIARFCAAAAAVYRLAPWETLATDDDVMMFDAPALGLNRACITVTGQLRETFGVLWIASAQDYRRYRAGLAQRDVGGGPAARRAEPRDLRAAR